MILNFSFPILFSFQRMRIIQVFHRENWFLEKSKKSFCQANLFELKIENDEELKYFRSFGAVGNRFNSYGFVCWAVLALGNWKLEKHENSNFTRWKQIKLWNFLDLTFELNFSNRRQKSPRHLRWCVVDCSFHSKRNNQVEPWKLPAAVGGCRNNWMALFATRSFVFWSAGVQRQCWSKNLFSTF